MNYFELKKQKKILHLRQLKAKKSLAKLINELNSLQKIYNDYQRGSHLAEWHQWQVKRAKLEQQHYELQSSIEELNAMKSRL